MENSLVGLFNVENLTEIDLAKKIEALRHWRQLCATDFASSVAFLEKQNLDKLVDLLTLDDSNYQNFGENWLILKRCSLQCLGNAISFTKEYKSHVFDSFCPIFPKLLENHDEKIRTYSAMVFYNCLSDSQNLRSFSLNIDQFSKIVKILLKSIKDEKSFEWNLYSIEYLLKNFGYFLCNIWPRLINEECSLLIEICIFIVDKECEPLNYANLQFLAHIFESTIENLVDGDEIGSNFNDKMVVFSQILTFLCKITQNPNAFSDQDGPHLLKAAIKLLAEMQIMTKSGHPMFKIKKDLQKKSSPENQVSLVYGIKQGLVNLIANLCYQSSQNQHLARDLDAIPLILDCTKIDLNNPFILQWCIFAVRNLLEDCVENQNVISNMNPKDFEFDQEMLNKLNLEPYFDDNGSVKWKFKR